MMKIEETLSPDDISDIIEGFEPSVGVFPKLIIETDPFYSLKEDMCLTYYLARSPSKTASNIYDRLLKVYESHSGTYWNKLNLVNIYIGEHIIRPKFIEKWTRIYNSLIASYDPLKSFDSTEHKIGDNSDSITYGSVLSKDGTNTDRTDYNSTVEDNGNTGTHETTTTSRNTEDGVYGFNSSASVGDSNSEDTTSETVFGNANDNTTHNLQTKGGRDTKTFDIDETESKTGTDTKTYGVDETITKSGRNSSSAELLDSELNLRDKFIFYDIVFKDIDSIITLSIY